MIKLDRVHKLFRKNDRRAPLIGIVKNTFGKTLASDYHCCLRDISFSINQGDKVGLIGNNGAGKTTLLKLISGLYQPSAGKIAVCGRVAFLAGFGTGMLDELTVAENANLYGAIYGLGRGKLETNLDEILSWAGLKSFRSTLYKHLSAGMKVRLAFSIYRYFEADIFLMDEALSAGDLDFQEKCHKILMEQKNTGRTMVFASHNIEFISDFCNRTIWIEQGQLKAFGDSVEVVDAYRNNRIDDGNSTQDIQTPTDGN